MSWRDRALVVICRGIVKPALTLPLPWALHRHAVRLLTPRTPQLDGMTVTRRTIAGIPCHVFAPMDAAGSLLWLHGGGFVLGSARSYARLALALAQRSGRRVILPEYRLAPEHPFPAGPDDCIAVARELIAEGPLALGGDSAGGTLALTTLADLLADGTPPERVVLVSPAVDLDPSRPTPDIRGEMIFPLALLHRVARDYVGCADPRDPRVSPIHAVFDNSPPVLIQCATGEVLEADTDAIAEHLVRAGVSVEVQKTDGVPHVWQLFVGRTPKADSAVDAMAAFLRGGTA